jgi:GTP cyclohydrolase I
MIVSKIFSRIFNLTTTTNNKQKKYMPRIKTNDDIPDIQNTLDGFPKKYIPKVGSRNIVVPMEIIRQDGTINPTKAIISMYTDLTPEVKGTNMSRYRILVEEVLANKTHRIDQVMDLLLDECKNRLKSQNAYIKIKFDYFMIKEAPVSKVKSHMDYQGSFEGRLINGEKKFYLHANVLYASLCPCSKEISDYGAHNQQSYADVTVELNHTGTEGKDVYWFEELVGAVERSSSAPIVNALKRVDEAYQTELMYENPVFVEDMVRKVAVELDKDLDGRIKDYLVIVNHYESIHSSIAVSVTHAGRDLK